MADYKIEELEGIGPKLGEKLRNVGITTVNDFLSAAIKKAQRKELAAKSGIAEKELLQFANMADLMRINGVAGEYAELLEAAGVDTVKELATRKPENLTAKMEEVNAAKKLVRRVPTLTMVTKWVAQAKELPGLLEY